MDNFIQMFNESTMKIKFFNKLHSSCYLKFLINLFVKVKY